jgi:hypothetical protein
MLRRIFGPKRDEIIGGLEETCLMSFITSTSSPDIIIMIKARRM